MDHVVCLSFKSLSHAVDSSAMPSLKCPRVQGGVRSNIRDHGCVFQDSATEMSSMTPERNLTAGEND